jgi:enoyl-CoA hydratase/carnithine racemase
MTDTTTTIIIQRDGPIGHLIIHNPSRRNAMSFDMWRTLGDALEALATDKSLRVIVMRGAGDKAFCVGNDISEFAQRRSSKQSITEYNVVMARAYEALHGLRLPTIARIEGYCIGGGLEISQLCDIQIAADNARFAVTPAKLGLGYKLDDVLLLTRNMNAKYVKELLMTGRQFDANEALRMGLINRVTPVAELDAVVEQYAAQIAANAPLSVKAAKLIVAEAVKEPAQRDRTLCQQLVDACHESDDYQEGQRAFAEKRQPNFQGR